MIQTQTKVINVIQLFICLVNDSFKKEEKGEKYIAEFSFEMLMIANYNKK